jgi:hypothetical protein
MRHQICTIGLIVVTVFALTGCPKEPTTPTILPAKAQPYVQDVPVPSDFKLDREKSDHSYTEGRRTIKHFYLGTAEPLAVRNFYVRNMPGADWQIVDEKLQNGVYTLTYRKAEERCEIRIEKIPAGMFSPSTSVRATVRSPDLER